MKHGQVQIAPGLNTEIQQLTDKAIIDWQSFSISANESVRFLQPAATSVVLNRVVGQDPSRIMGMMQANGSVFLINPNGILFGPNSQVNVGGLLASTLDISDADFLAGRYAFEASTAEGAAVVNQGRLEATDGGYVVLTGSLVSNEGLIVARAGTVALGAGRQTTLNLDGRDLVHFATQLGVGEGAVLLAPGMMSQTLSDALGVDPALQATQIQRLPDGSTRLSHGNGLVVVRDGLLEAASGTLRINGRALLTGGQLGTLNQTTGQTIVVVTLTAPGYTPEDQESGEPFLDPERHAVLAQNNVDLVEDFLPGVIFFEPPWNEPEDPTYTPPLDEEFLRAKFRR